MGDITLIRDPRLETERYFLLRFTWLSAALVLLALGACSDGDDLAGPPAGGNFTLTVAGDGTGSGHVATAPGVEPAISCDLAGTSPSGTCSATYPAGTVVEPSGDAGPECGVFRVGRGCGELRNGSILFSHD